TRVLERGDFRGRSDETLLLYPREGEIAAERVLVIGAGKREDYTLDRLRRAVGTAFRQAEKLAVRDVALSLGHLTRLSEQMGPALAARGAIEAAVLATWDLREYKTVNNDDSPRVIELVTL